MNRDHEDFIDLGDAVIETKGEEIVTEDTDNGEQFPLGISFD